MLVLDHSTLPDLAGAIATLRDAVDRLDDYLVSKEAASLVELFSEGERLCAAGRTLAARQVERSGVWKEQGHRSAAQWMATATGVSVGQAVGALETARRLEHLSATAQAFRSGELSEAKVKEVAQAACANRRAEGELLEAARTGTVTFLKERCRKATAAGATDENNAYERIKMTRYLRHWTDPEGAFLLAARLTADDGARVLAGMEPHRQRIFTEARRAGRRESSEAYAADALVALATEGAHGGTQGAGPGPGGPPGARSGTHRRWRGERDPRHRAHPRGRGQASGR